MGGGADPPGARRTGRGDTITTGANRCRILVADPIADAGLRALASFPDLEIVQRDGLTGEQLIDEIVPYAGLLVRSRTRVTRAMIAAAPHLRVIGRAGAGVDNIDVAAATDHGVLVINTPGTNAEAVAELTIGLMFALARRITAAAAAVKAGSWERGTFCGTQLVGKTLGIIGLGHVGRAVAWRAAGLGMQVIAHDPYLTPAAVTEQSVTLVPLDDLLAQADYVTVHTPLTSASRALIGGSEIAHMKRGVYLINCARGGVIDEQALLAGLDSGQVAAAALDVFSREPPGSLAIVQHPRVVATPHIGALSAEAQHDVAVAIANHVGRFLTAGETAGAVNPEAIRR